MARIRLEALRHSYLAQPAREADWALKRIDLEWQDGGAYALLGPSGCGKTTLLSIVSGLLRPTSGRVYFGEEDVTDRPLYARMSAFGRLDDCIVHHGTKFIRYMDPASGRVLGRTRFDLASDPREAQNLGADPGDEEQRLLEEEAGDHGVRFDASFEAPDPDVLDQLQELGYMGEEPARSDESK